jgi:hypothetical protein
MACNCNKKKVDEDYINTKNQAIRFVEKFDKSVFLYKDDVYWFVDEYSCIPSQATNVEYVSRLLLSSGDELY